MANDRKARLQDQIKRIIATVIDEYVTDPRLGFVTILDVEVSQDVENAKVYYSTLGDQEQKKASQEALDSAKGMIRSELAKVLDIKHTPALEFIQDDTLEKAQELDAKIDESRTQDQKIDQAAQNATPAGGKNPYKHTKDPAEAQANKQDDQQLGERKE